MTSQHSFNKDTISLRRNKRTCPSSDWNQWLETELASMEGTFALQEYVQQRSRLGQDLDGCPCPEGQDERSWLFENIRQFCIELNDVFVAMEENSTCSKSKCPQMRTSEGEDALLCSTHIELMECSAIDYARHSLDRMSDILTSVKTFPSRLSISDEGYRVLMSICVQIGRILNHFRNFHSTEFDEIEEKYKLWEKFTGFVEYHALQAFR